MKSDFVLGKQVTRCADGVQEAWTKVLLCLPLQEVSCRHTDLLSLDPACVSVGGLASLQQPGAIRLLEEALLHLTPQEPPAKRARRRPSLPPDTVRWMELAK